MTKKGGDKDKGKKPADRVVARNRKAFHEFYVEERYEAGLVLMGSEIKSIRDGQVSIQESFVRPIRGELYLIGCHIAEYPQAKAFNHEPTRPRKLLLHHREIDFLVSRLERKGLTVVPLDLHFTNGRAKLEIGLCRGKTHYDKRDAMRKREHERDMAKAKVYEGRKRS